MNLLAITPVVPISLGSYHRAVPRYQDVYPSEPLIRSADVVRPKAAALLSLEYFEAEPATMPTEAFDQHHVLVNLKDTPHRVENWRNGVHRDFILEKNQIVVTPAGTRSGWRWHQRSKVIIITLEPARLQAFARSELGRLLTERQLLDLPQFKDADIATAAVMLMDALHVGGPESDVMFESLARVFLVKLIYKYGEDDGGDAAFSASYTADQHRRLLTFLEREFSHAIGVEEMARTVGLSSSHFSRVFKKVVGEPPHQFLLRYRIERAIDMLVDPARPLLDIALACGFSDQPHFTRVFKQHNGQTPRQWRRNNG